MKKAPSEKAMRATVESKGGVYLGCFPRVIPDERAAEYVGLKTPRWHLRCELLTKDKRQVYALPFRKLEGRPGMITPTLYYRLENHQRWDFQPGESWTADDEEKFQAENIVTGSFKGGGVHPNLRAALDRISPRKIA